MAGIAVIASGAALSAPQAFASDTSTGSPDVMIREYKHTNNGAQEFVVPESVHFMDVEVVGARGGDGASYRRTNNDPIHSGAQGGAGAEVTGKLSVTPGQKLSLIIAEPGHAGDANQEAGRHGWGYGVSGSAGDAKSGHRGGGGGGASAILPDGKTTDPLVVAGGGGGGGGHGLAANDANKGGGGGGAGAQPEGGRSGTGPYAGEGGIPGWVVAPNINGRNSKSYSGSGGGGGGGTQSGGGGMAGGVGFLDANPSGGGGGGAGMSSADGLNDAHIGVGHGEPLIKLTLHLSAMTLKHLAGSGTTQPLVADAKGWNKEPGSPVIAWEPNGGDNQKWYLRLSETDPRYYSIVNVHSGLCLDAEAEGNEPGTPLIQWNCNGQYNQLFKWDKGNGQLISSHTRLPVALKDGSAGAQLVLGGLANSDRWAFE
ncbi:RICIN domain-containing protein [Streptomyces sp. NPDC008343]|uniref:RICIN domain-containing protein n=1 Tax=Streptomyces sp. NPDC008343 TaxID=3364828 RepID=UPI0036ECDDBB